MAKETPIEITIEATDLSFFWVCRENPRFNSISLLTELVKAQSNDTTVASAKKQLQESQRIDHGPFRKQAGMQIIGELLYRGKKVVVLRPMRDEIIGLVHNEGHFGVDKTTLLTRARFFWRGMNPCSSLSKRTWPGKYIDFFCKKCSICARNKPKNAPPETLVPSIQASRPREAIAYDIATLPYANTNHRHFLLIVDTFSKFMNRDQVWMESRLENSKHGSTLLRSIVPPITQKGMDKPREESSL